MSGFDPSGVEVLSLGYTTPPVECTKARWYEVLKPFDARARSHAATLAAHNWDALLIGDRIFLYQSRYGGDLGHWLNHDGTREEATSEQMAALYSKKDGSIRRLFSDSDADQGGAQ